MQIVKIMGGLGNQMFAYAFALALRENGQEVYLDTSWHTRHKTHNGWELGKIFKLNIPESTMEDNERLGDLGLDFLSRIRRKFIGFKKSHIKEYFPGYNSDFLNVDNEVYFDGFWQSYKYHEGIESEIETAFQFSVDLEPEAKFCLNNIKDRTKVGIHVRRGDYLKSKTLYGVCNEEYYSKAMVKVLDGLINPVIFFFSDDLDWCKTRFGINKDKVFVDWNRGINSWKDMRLMTLCDRLVISNSSFGWWGGRLGKTKNRMIIAPSKWFGGNHPDNYDIIPDSWIRIPSGD